MVVAAKRTVNVLVLEQMHTFDETRARLCHRGKTMKYGGEKANIITKTSEVLQLLRLIVQ